MDVLNFVVRGEVHVNECIFGVFGFLNDPDDFFDCFWRRYAPLLPLYEISAIDLGDLSYDYLPWECNFHDQQQTPEMCYLNERGQEICVINGVEHIVEDIDDEDEVEI